MISQLVDNNLTCDNHSDDSSVEYTRDRTDNKLQTQIYRFKFTELFMDELHNFSKIHQYDDRKDFKEAWNIWIEDNEDIIEEETNRLEDLGYEGDVLDKMFKSARYYFRKKSTEKKQPKQRRNYINVSHNLLSAMDAHIEENIYNVDYQPKTGFSEFCEEYDELLKETIKGILDKGINDSELIQNKIKKTYKNRYFIITNKNKL